MAPPDFGRRRRGGLFSDFDDADDFKMPVGEPFDRMEKSVEFVHRAEHILSEIRLLQEDLKELWQEAKEYDLDTNVIKTVIKRRSKTKHENDEFDCSVSELELKLDEEGDDDEE